MKVTLAGKVFFLGGLAMEILVNVIGFSDTSGWSTTVTSLEVSAIAIMVAGIGLKTMFGK